MMYHSNVHYDTQGLTLGRKLEMLAEAKTDSYRWWADKLDCAVSSARQHLPDMPFEEIVAMLDEKAHFVVIHRRGYDENRADDFGRWYLEVGFCTMGSGINHYLWVQLDEKHIEAYATKYGLAPTEY